MKSANNIRDIKNKKIKSGKNIKSGILKTPVPMKLSILLVVLIILPAFLLNISGCKKEEPDIETFEVIKGDIVEIISSTGTVDSTEKRNYSLIQSGEVLEILKKGEIFKKGEVIIKIDDSKAMLYVSQAEQNLKLAEKSIDIARINYQSALDANHVVVQLAETNSTMAEQATLNAYKALDNASNLSNASIKAAYDSMQTAKDYLDSVKNSIISTDIMVAQAEGNITAAENAYEQAKKSSKSQADAAEGAYEQALISQSLTYWNNINSMEMAEAQIKLVNKSIEQAEIQLELANINLELVKTELDNFQVYAPFDGIVFNSNFNVGETAGPGVAAISIMSSDFIIRSDINETDITKLETGQEVALTLDAYMDLEFKGTITKISQLPNNIAGIVSYEIEVTPEDPAKEYLKPGFSANLNITVSKMENILYVPLQAVYEEDGKSYVDVLMEENEAKKVEITTGNFNYDYIEVKSGLSEGDIVIISGLEATEENGNSGFFGMMGR